MMKEIKVCCWICGKRWAWSPGNCWEQTCECRDGGTGRVRVAVRPVPPMRVFNDQARPAPEDD